jgi:hypothetical protein
MTRLFMMDAAYDVRAKTQRQEIEQQIAALRTQRWSRPEDRREIDEQIVMLEAVLRQLDSINGGGTP